jgi:hypothetical protein
MTSTPNFIFSVFAAALLCCSSSSAHSASIAKEAEGVPVDSRRDMITALPAAGPHPSLGDQARVFDRFVGTWDCDYATYSEDGKVTRFSGEVIFGWIIDGHAMQDIWISQPKGATERSIGTSVRYYDGKSATWRVVWIAPTADTIIKLTGGLVGDRIVLLGQDTDGSPLRWSFNEIHPESFVWRGESSRDGGKTWWLQEEHHMKRRNNMSARP